jgi:DNA topoisomerase-2
MWVFDSKKERLLFKEITYVPGLYKIFGKSLEFNTLLDEILVNSADNYHKDKSMTMVKVTIDKEANTISVWNNGKGVPVQIHQTEKVYVPELVFGHMLTSSNFDDSVKKVTGGRNGFGAKLTNIFSKKFTVTTADSKNKKKYTQVFEKNLSVINPPKIVEFSSDSYDFTEVVFEPDFSRFKMKGGLDSDSVMLLSKRVYDLAGVTPASVGVYLNGKKL